MVLDPAHFECASWENTAQVGLPGLHNAGLVLEKG